MKKRLLFITPIFPKNNSEDSVVPFITHFTNHFAEETDVKIDVISLMYPFEKKKYEFGKITVYPIGSNFRKSFRIIPFLVFAIWKGIQLTRKNNYDGILCFWYRESALIGKVISKILKKKQIIWMLGQDIRKDNKYIKLLNINKTKLVMLSFQQSNFFIKNHQIEVSKIANVAINRNLFPELNKLVREIDILGVGYLGALKNYSMFIEIVSLIQTKDCKAIIIGKGDELEMLNKKTKQLGLSKNIQFIGAKTHNEVLNYMNNAKVFLHTSISEGAGTVLQEALYLGCKVVSTIDIENNLTNENFYFNKEKEKLIDRINFLLGKNLVADRIENFKMEDTVKVIYDSFYND